MSIRRRLITLAAALMSLSASMAHAGPIYNITTTAPGGGSQLETLTWKFNGVSETGLAGTLTTTLGSGGPQFSTYCIDIYHSFYLGSSWSAELKSISSYAGESDRPAGTNAGGNAGAIGYLYNTFAARATTAIEGAALQVAIWKVDYDDNNSFSTGSFQFAPTSDPGSIQSQVYAQASSYLSGFDGTQSSNQASYLMATSHPNAMNQDFVGPGGVLTNAAAVPEPSSILLVLAGVASTAVRARRARRLAKQS